jgi:transposase-like protein
MSSKTYSAKFKFRVVLEVLQSERSQAEIARAYDVHPVTVSNWKTQFMDEGAKVFGGDEELKRQQKKIADLEQLLGKKEVEIALLKNFLGGS